MSRLGHHTHARFFPPNAAAMQEPDWSSLAADLLEDIVDLLPWSSHPRFAAVLPFYPAWLTPVLLNAADVGSTNVRYFCPYLHKLFEISDTLESPNNARICCARGRHLTLCQRTNDEDTAAHIDLVTGAISDLYPLQRCGFDFVVYDGGRRMFGVQAIGLAVARAIQCDRGGWYPWEFSELSPAYGDGSRLTASPVTSPVLHRGLLYLLGIDGRLAVHDDRRHEEGGFLVLDKPGGFGPGRDDADECYLFESDEGELGAVLVGRRGTPVRVVRLDEQEMEWEEVESLRGRAVFTGTPATVVVETGVEWMRDRIFVPRLHSWPETIHAGLVERGGELAFVPAVSAAAAARDGGAGEKGIWSCRLEPGQSEKFWETIKFYQGIWVNFRT